MTTSVPPSDGGDNSADHSTGQGPEVLEQGTGAPLADSGTGRGRRTALLAGAGVGALAIVGAGVWAGMAFFANGAQPSEALPASTMGYVSMDLDPSGEQQLEAYQTLRKFPAIAEYFEEGDNPLRNLFEELQKESSCPDLSYADDIDPWAGSSLAVAAVDNGDGEVAPTLVLALDDADAADAGLEKLAACGEDSDESGAWAISGDWAVIAEDQATADGIVAATEDGTLADDATHQRWMDEMGDLGVMSMYIAGGEAYTQILETMPDADTAELEGMTEDLKEQMANFQGGAGTVRFSDGGLEMVFAGDASYLEDDFGFRTGAGDAVAALPADTALAYAVSVDGEKLINAMSTYMDSVMEAQGMSTDQMWSELEAQSGLTLPEDFGTLLGESFTLAVGGDFDVETAANSSDGSDIPIGARIEGDADGIESVLDKLRPLAGAQAETVLGSDTEGDVVAIGPNPDYRGALLSDGGLGDSDAFDEVMGDVESAAGVMFIDFDAGDGWLVKLAEDADPKVAENLEPLSALGVTGGIDGDVMRSTIRVTTD